LVGEKRKQVFRALFKHKCGGQSHNPLTVMDILRPRRRPEQGASCV
jgi:hypothetical protein